MCNITKQISQGKLITKVFFSTCVDESLLCKGIPLCKNKNDLKVCKMNIPTKDWVPIYEHTTCISVDHPEYNMQYGQTIYKDLMTDDSHFYCLNRGDTNPFSITNSESNVTDADSLTWTQWINEPCTDDEDHCKRRCLGLRPDICVFAVCKYILLKMI